MWANREVADLLAVLRGHNAGRPPADRVGFFGLDVYSLWESLRAILDYLRAHHPDQVDAALEAYRCFEPYTGDERAYARSTALVPPGCAEEVASLLAGTKRRAAADDTGAGISGGGGLTRLAAVQNAEVVANAEGYYRAMVGGGPQAWNIRDRHMAATLDRLIEHGGPGARSWCGRTTPTSATRAPPTWRRRAWSTWASSCASATRPTAWWRWGSAPTAEPWWPGAAGAATPR